MINPNLNVEALRSLIGLYDRREALLKELDSIDNNIANLLAGKKPSGKIAREKVAKKSATRKSTAKKEAAKAPKEKASANSTESKPGRKPSKTADKVLRALKSVGPEGISVKDLAKKTNLRDQSLHVWFSSTGSKMPEIIKVKRGHYALKA